MPCYLCSSRRRKEKTRDFSRFASSVISWCTMFLLFLRAALEKCGHNLHQEFLVYECALYKDKICWFTKLQQGWIGLLIFHLRRIPLERLNLIDSSFSLNNSGDRIFIVCFCLYKEMFRIDLSFFYFFI